MSSKIDKKEGRSAANWIPNHFVVVVIPNSILKLVSLDKCWALDISKGLSKST